MVGIISYGAYIPFARMQREIFYKFWGGFHSVVLFLLRGQVKIIKNGRLLEGGKHV